MLDDGGARHNRPRAAVSDIMLGWIRTTEWVDGVNRDFYVTDHAPRDAPQEHLC